MQANHHNINRALFFFTAITSLSTIIFAVGNVFVFGLWAIQIMLYFSALIVNRIRPATNLSYYWTRGALLMGWVYFIVFLTILLIGVRIIFLLDRFSFLVDTNYGRLTLISFFLLLLTTLDAFNVQHYVQKRKQIILTKYGIRGLWLYRFGIILIVLLSILLTYQTKTITYETTGEFFPRSISCFQDYADSIRITISDSESSRFEIPLCVSDASQYLEERNPRKVEVAFRVQYLFFQVVDYKVIQIADWQGAISMNTTTSACLRLGMGPSGCEHSDLVETKIQELFGYFQNPHTP